jgi:molybdate transport system ATP-binding protein
MSIPSTPAALIELDRVDVEIAGVPVLHDVTWRLEPGVNWGIVGPNGSGKSTFLALAAGTRWPAPNRGVRRYDFGAGPETDALTARREIATVGPELQDRYARWDWNFNAIDVVLSGLFRTDVPRKEPTPAEAVRARAMLRELGLAELAERPFLELSRGEQRRVLIARAIAFGARVLLLDEPASGLDTAARRELDGVLDRAAAHAQWIATAHAVEDLPRRTTHVMELEAGRIVRSGRRSDVEAATTMTSRGQSTGAASASTPEPARAAAAAGRDTTGAGPDFAHAASPSPAPSSEPLIDIRHADVWLGERRVLHAIDWRLRNTEHWLVTGANGAGKSTFLRLLHGQLRPARGGSIRWPGLGAPRSVWTLRRRIAWVSPALQADYRYRTTVRECVASGFDSSLGLVRRLTPAERDRVELLLERFALHALAERLVAELSYGQFRRALLARTLAPSPRVLLLDEPWEGLDRATSRLLAERLDESTAEGLQLVCASHLDFHRDRFTHELVLAAGCIVSANSLS